MLWYHKFIGLVAGASLLAVAAHGQAAKINKIGPEEVVSSEFMDRPSISTDSKSQPHFVCDAGGNTRFMKFHKVGGKWYGGVFAVGAKGGKYNAGRLYIGQIEVDAKDRAWISCKFGAKEFGVLGQGIWLFRDVATDPTPPEQFFRNVNVYKGMGVVMTDTKKVDEGVVIGTFGNYNILNQYGQVIKEGSINAGHGGEKVRGRIGSYAPRFPVKGEETKAYPDSIWHTAMNGSHAISSAYQSSLRYKNGYGPVTWADYGAFPIMGDDYHHPGVQPDLSDPKVCYINTVFYGKMCAQIWDGSKMLFGTSFLKVLDYGAAFEPRHAPAIAPAPGPAGGAFFFWSKGSQIWGCYLSKKGEAGKVIPITYGRTAAAATDRNGDIHLVYYNNGIRYRKLDVSTLDTIEPEGIVTDTRMPAFRWSNTKAASYTIEITRDGVKQPVETVTGASTWTPGSDLAVGDYSWRVKEGGAFSASAWSPSADFIIPPATPVAVSPEGRFPTAPVTPNLAWTCNDGEVTRFTVQLFKGADLYGTMNVISNGLENHDADWTNALPAGNYAWQVRSSRVLTGHTVVSPWSQTLEFVVGVPGTCQITDPADGSEYPPGGRTTSYTWTEAEGATSYRLRLIHNGNLFESIDNIASTSQSVTANFWPGYYSATVLPKNADGNGSWSAPVTIEVNRQMRPANDNTLDAGPAKLTWTRSKDATRYLAKLSRYDYASRTYEVIRERWVDQSAWDVVPSWIPSYDFPAGAYRWSVTDFAGAQGNYTSVAYFQVKVPGRPVLQAPVYSGATSHTIEFIWTDPSASAKEFQIEVWKGTDKLRDTTFLPKAEFVKTLGVFSRTFNFSDSILGPLTWRVQARNPQGSSPWREGAAELTPGP